MRGQPTLKNSPSCYEITSSSRKDVLGLPRQKHHRENMQNEEEMYSLIFLGE